jgi:uncharacterized membrane protein
MNFQTMSKQRKYILIAAAVGIISVFLPWATVSVSFAEITNIRNGFYNYGIAAFLGFLVAAAVVLLGDQTKTLDKSMWIVSMIAGTISLLFIILFMGDISQIMKSPVDRSGLVKVSSGFGIWIALASSIGIIAFAWLFKNSSDNLKGAFDSLKKDISVAASSISKASTNAKTPDNNPAQSTNKIAELERLSKLKESGSITEEEFSQLKSKILSGN